MGFEPPSACLLTAADSLLSLFPMTDKRGENRPPLPSKLLSQLRHESKERTKAAGAAAKVVSWNDGKVHVIYRANKRADGRTVERLFLGFWGFLRNE